MCTVWICECFGGRVRRKIPVQKWWGKKPNGFASNSVLADASRPVKRTMPLIIECRCVFEWIPICLMPYYPFWALALVLRIFASIAVEISGLWILVIYIARMWERESAHTQTVQVCACKYCVYRILNVIMLNEMWNRNSQLFAMLVERVRQKANAYVSNHLSIVAHQNFRESRPHKSGSRVAIPRNLCNNNIIK